MIGTLEALLEKAERLERGVKGLYFARAGQEPRLDHRSQKTPGRYGALRVFASGDPRQ